MTPNPRIAKAEAQLAAAQKRMADAKATEKLRRKRLAQLKRNERTHQLCVRGGELNKHLHAPDALTDEEVAAFLDEIFQIPEGQQRLNLLPHDSEEVT